MRITFFFILILSVSGVSGQNLYYGMPLRNKLVPVKGFAEIDKNGFHPGVDFATLGKTEMPVMAVADGYISRVVISSEGLGKALFLAHDNGTTSVYGQLSQLRPDIENYLRQVQFKIKSFETDTRIEPETFLIKKGDIIALSGTAQESTEPHLHFEIRNTSTGDLLNPQLFGFEIKDTIAPKINALQVIPISAGSHVNFGTGKVIFDTELNSGNYKLKNSPVIQLYGETGFAIEVEDYADISGNKGSIAEIQLLIEDEVVSVFNGNRFSINEIPAINGWIDFEERQQSMRNFRKTWKPTCNALSNFEFSENNGILDVALNKDYNVKIIVKDAAENISVLEFIVTGKYREINAEETGAAAIFSCNKVNQYATDDFQIKIPENSLFEDLHFNYTSKNRKDGFLSDLHQISNIASLKSPATISIKCNDIQPENQDKLLIVKVEEPTGKTISLGGEFENGWVRTEINTFGNFAVKADTTAPVIESISISNNRLTETDKLRFNISDDLSGIGKIEGLLDGEWVLFEYNKYSNQITHTFDTRRFDFTKTHQIKLTVIDKCGNQSVYETPFGK